MTPTRWQQILMCVGFYLFSSPIWATATPSTYCAVSYSTSRAWSSGYIGQFVLTNTGAPLDLRTLGWNLPSGQRVTQVWGASFYQNRQRVIAQPRVTFRYLPSGKALNVLFSVRTSTATAVAPTNFRVNGKICIQQNQGGTPTPVLMPTTLPQPTGIPPIATSVPTPTTVTAEPTASPKPTTVTPIPTATTAPQPTPTSELTPTVQPTATPTVAGAPTPTATTAPTITAVPTAVNTPTPTSVTTPTVQPTLATTPTITSTPTVTATTTPTVTAAPTMTTTPTVTVTPAPTSTPLPTATQAPTPTATAQVPQAPAKLTASVVDNARVDLSWVDASDNESGFALERRKAGETNWAALTETAPDSQTYSDTTIEMGQNYEYRLLAFNNAGRSAEAATTVSVPTLVAYGESQFKAKLCSTCHGNDGSGGSVNRPLNHYGTNDLPRITDVISTQMPLTAPGTCKGNCAKGIAQYLVEVLNQGGSTPPGGVACNTPPPGPRSLRLLTRIEYQNTVNDLFNLSLDIVEKLPPENRLGGYDNDFEHNLVTDLRAEAFLNQAESIAKQAVQDRYGTIVPCAQENAACAKQFVESFGKRAYRRPLTAEEVSSYTGLFAQGSFRDNVSATVLRVLLSPHFLYRSELGELQSDGTYKLTPYEVASSLSYVFLGSMPDAALFAAADSGALSTPEALQAQAERLLAMARSRQQVANFGKQWLIAQSQLPAKDPAVYPNFTVPVQTAMTDEIGAFLNHVIFDSSGKYPELLTADYVMANNTLAGYYGIAGPGGNTFTLTPVTDGTRGGLLKMGGVLARYANANESHPFKRGVYVMERLLCHEMPPPQNLGFVEAPVPDPNATTRERFAIHSNSSPVCQGCHRYLDGPGFALEGYDGAGQSRSTENGRPIQTDGILRGMETFTATEENPFKTVDELAKIVADSKAGPECVARQFYRFTFGRRPGDADACALGGYLSRYEQNGYDLQFMLKDIVTSPAFILRSSN